MRPQSVHEGEVWPTKDGDICVLEYYSATDILVEFVDTGYQCRTRAGEIKRGAGIKDRLRPSVYGVGYIGVGEFKANSRRHKSAAYGAWNNMLERCYSKKYQKKYPYWKDCTVCDKWHNFQNFARWFFQNYIEGYDLDKDMQITGNRMYCPEACKFIPPSENRLTRGKPTGQYAKRKLAKANGG